MSYDRKFKLVMSVGAVLKISTCSFRTDEQTLAVLCPQRMLPNAGESREHLVTLGFLRCKLHIVKPADAHVKWPCVQSKNHFFTASTDVQQQEFMSQASSQLPVILCEEPQAASISTVVRNCS